MSVVREDVEAALLRAPARAIDHRNHAVREVEGPARIVEFLRREHPAVSGDDAVRVRKHLIGSAKLKDAFLKLLDLLVAVGPGVPRVRDEAREGP